MITNLKKVFNLTNKYIILATPLILFSLLSNIYALFSANGRIINLLIALLLLTLMTGAFLAGWLVMVKKAVDDEYPYNPNSLIKDYVSGVGEYFLPATGGIVCTTIFSFVLLALAFVLGSNFIGDIGITAEQLSKAMESNEALKLFMTSLTLEQMTKISQWNILLLSSMFSIYFLLIFYFPAIFYKTKNPFLALFISLKDLFSRKFFIVLAVVIFIAIGYLFLSAMSAITSQSLILHFFITMTSFYLMIALVIWLFDFYNRNFVLSHLGQNIDETI